MTYEAEKKISIFILISVFIALCFAVVGIYKQIKSKVKCDEICIDNGYYILREVHYKDNELGCECVPHQNIIRLEK